MKRIGLLTVLMMLHSVRVCAQDSDDIGKMDDIDAGEILDDIGSEMTQDIEKETAEATAKAAARAAAEAAAEAAKLVLKGHPQTAVPPVKWPANNNDPDCRALAAAVKKLVNARNALAAQLERRGKADAGKESPTDVFLLMDDALTSYANAIQRPVPVPAPQWQDYVGQSLDRIHGMRHEFMPEREDGRFFFGRRGGEWFGPRMTMLTSKFRQQYHLRSCDASAMRADANGVSGSMALTSARGDFRYDMHFSGEGTGNAMAEFGGGDGGGFFPDWWIGPREALKPWTQSLKLTANRRRGWILDAGFSTNDNPVAGTAGVRRIWAWADEGRLYRSSFLNHIRVRKWKAENKTFEAELAVMGGVYTIQAGLSDADSGVVNGTVRLPANNKIEEHNLHGTLYRAFVGTYESGGVDGKWTDDLLAGVARSEPESIPALPAPPSAPADLSSYGLEVYRQVAALDWALRRYPLPFAKTLQLTRQGVHDRLRLWYAGWDRTRHKPVAGDHLHLALAWAMGRNAAGAAAYMEGLAAVAQRAAADREASVNTVVGLTTTTDPEFAPTATGPNEDWIPLKDWSCFGFVPRQYSFDRAPYLPELFVDARLYPNRKRLEVGQPMRLENDNPRQHVWFWRAAADPTDNAVTIPIECIRIGGQERDTWGHVTEGEGYKHYLDGSLVNQATWYAAARYVAKRAARTWLAVKIEWDGRVWVNGSLVWRPDKLHTPHRIAVVPVDLAAGTNRITVCVSPRPTSDGNSGKLGPLIYKYGERAYGSAAVWLSRGGEPRKPEVVAAQRAKEDKADLDRAAPGIRGRRGDGSGRYPDATPALAWDLEKGINVRWKAELPTDDAEPVVVGEKLFVTTREGELACLDAATGKQLWRRRPEVKGTPPPDRAKYPPPGSFASFTPARRWKTLDRTATANAPALKRSCLTPLASKDRVWMHDPAGVVACFDHGGAPIWARAVPAQTPRFTTGAGTYIPVHLFPPTHPAIVGKKLVGAVGEGMAAFDIETGAQPWRREELDYNGHFAVMDLGDDPSRQLILLSSCEVLDAANGDTLIPRCAPLMPDSACQPVVEGRIAYFNACSSAVRFWHDEKGNLRHELLWDSPTDIRKRQACQNHGNHAGAPDPDFFGQSTGASPPTPVLYNGTLFVHLAEPNTIMRGHQNSMRLQTYDAATGCAVAQRYALLMNGMRPASSAVVAGGYAFLPDEGCTMPYNYINFPQGIPMIAIVTAEDQPRRISESRGLASLAPPTFAGRRMYMAGSDEVVCIERPEALGDKFSGYELAALKKGFFTREIGNDPGAWTEIAIEPHAFIEIGKDVPVVRLKGSMTVSPWLFAGPFSVDKMTDVFQHRGGAGAIQPEAGMTVSYTRADGNPAKAMFVLLDDKDAPTRGLNDSSKKKLIDRLYAGALRNAKLEGAINCATATGRKYNTTCYAYTVLEPSEAGSWKIEVLGGGKLKSYDLYMAGNRVQNGSIVELKPGRYPLMARVAIAACGDWEQLEFGVHLRPVPKAMPPPEPFEGPLPQGIRVSVEPLQFGQRFPATVVGVWPLDENAVEEAVRAVLARPGALVGEGDAVAAGAAKVVFKQVPGGLFRDRKNARGVFCALVEYDRDIAVEFTMPEHMRCWLSGREMFTSEAVPLAAGRYPLMMTLGSSIDTKSVALVPTITEVAPPAVARERWLARIRKNEKMLRAIAASGPKGAYAREALDVAAAVEKECHDERQAGR